MIWEVCLVLSFICLCTGYVAALRIITGKTHKTSNALYVSFAGVITACIIIYIPIYSLFYAGEVWVPVKCFLAATHSAIRLFMVDGEFINFKEALTNAGITSGKLYTLYTIFTGILFVNAPLLTFSFIFSFLKRINERVHYMFGVWKNCYVFSDLNEYSITLAENITGENLEDLKERKKKQKGKQIVFTDVFRANNEESSELFDRAEKIGAVCFRKDILSVNFAAFPRGKKELYFFIMGKQRSENLTQALQLIQHEKYHYRERENTRLFYFSDDENSDLQFSSIDKGKIKVKRVNMARVLIDRMLYENGYKLFEAAKEEQDGMRRIRAVVVGLGRHGSNMLRALSWFCQMDGYDLEIDAFDKDPLAQEKLELQCPDLLSGRYNGKKDPAEALYTISIHPGINIESRKFADEIAKLPETNFVIVAVGDDEKNLQTAVALRMLYERMGRHPQIRAIIYNSDERKALEGAHNFAGSSYDIDFFGDLASTYSEEVIINSELEDKALNLHKGWADPELPEEEQERLFWDYEYNYRSSIATAIHQEAISQLEERGLHHQDADNEEHRRWNAYMRSEGYIYDGSYKYKQKNHIAKIHGDLVSNDVLRQNKEEFEKDKKIKEAAQKKK